MDKITIYTNDTCSYCKQIKEKLTEKNIKFENKTGEDHKDEWQDVVRASFICVNRYFIHF